MATRPKKPVEVGQAQVGPDQAAELLRKQVEAGGRLLAERPVDADAYSTWGMLTRNYLEKAFGANSPNVTAITSVGKYGSFPMNAGNEWWERHRAESLQSQLAKLNGLIELLVTEKELQSGHSIAVPASARGHKIFLVHGHDALALQETARFLEKLDQEVIILREQPNRGRTVIEKFEDYADVGFAVVLLTPDDRGGTTAEPFDQQKHRARQNVVFELGYFIGRLGRNRVCALYRPGVDLTTLAYSTKNWMRRVRGDYNLLKSFAQPVFP